MNVAEELKTEQIVRELRELHRPLDKLAVYPSPVGKDLLALVRLLVKKGVL